MQISMSLLNFHEFQGHIIEILHTSAKFDCVNFELIYVVKCNISHWELNHYQTCSIPGQKRPAYLLLVRGAKKVN